MSENIIDIGEGFEKTKKCEKNEKRKWRSNHAQE